MRLLHTRTKKLRLFYDDQIPPYAILSHRWGADELTYADIANSSIIPSNVKIDGCCEQAVSDGLEYIWIDTLCIDKSSSSELSEAINSMFAWYRDSQVCYAYLSDVASVFDWHQNNEHAEFRSSNWFNRGWTLQELLAPKGVRFYTNSWKFLGSTGSANQAFCTLLRQITVIPKDIISGIQSIKRSSIAAKMAWAAHRRTTRTEDMAYCLLGIFDINMPLLYGEGDKSFKRLQEEIIRQSDDDSLLAWGLSLPGERKLNSGLLAISPADFMGCRDIRFLSGRRPSMRNLPHYSMTNKGLLIERPFVQLPQPFGTILMPLDCSIGYQDHILALPLIGNLSKGSQLRTGPSTKPVLVSAKVFLNTPMSSVYIRTSGTSGAQMPRMSTAFKVKVEQAAGCLEHSIHVLESYPTSCAGLRLGNAQLVEQPITIAIPPWELSETKGPVAQTIMFRFRGSNDRTYLVHIVTRFQPGKVVFDHKKDSLSFGVVWEEDEDMSLAEFILQEYADGRSSNSMQWPHSSADGFIHLKLDSSPNNWVLTFLIGHALSPGTSLVPTSSCHAGTLHLG